MKLIIKYFDKCLRRKTKQYHVDSLDFKTWPKQARDLISSLDNVIEGIYYIQYDIYDYKQRLESG